MPERDFAPFMREAITLAKKGRFHVYPNPTVGAVLLHGDKIVARGWHKAAGQAHAEIECLENARAQGVETKGATMVVTLEPCKHHGKTAPCVGALREGGISTLVFGARDPNPEAAGGADILAQSGMEVIGPVLQRECEDLIADFIVWQTARRPYVILKLASTLDGRIATRAGHSRWISSAASRRMAHQLRGGIGLCGGAILIGGGTFRNDNPSLTSRLEGAPETPQPLACILTSRLPKADADFHLLRERPNETIFFASPAATASTTAEALRKKGCRVLPLGPNARGTPDFSVMFREMWQNLGCPYVLCEGGGRLALSLLEAGYIDEFHLHLSPTILGDNEAKPLFNGRAPLSLEDALKMRFCSTAVCDGDVHLLLRPA